jgi:peptidoglycan/xylan/chitin deacetylase (PgdA/CDA1 family)
MKATLSPSSRQKFKAAALIGSGISSLAKRRSGQEASIVTFHGLCDGMGDEKVLDWSLHLPVEIFRRVCAFLASNYHVISMRDLVSAIKKGDGLEPNSVLLTFDDGYASNYHLAFPILKEFNLPATVFVTTGFLDGTEKLWFQRLDLAFGTTTHPYLDWEFEEGKQRLPLTTRPQRQEALVKLLPELKRMPDEDFLSEIDRVERLLGVTPLPPHDLPAPMRALTWDQAREMKASGLVEIGAHTHTHPILARCSPNAIEAEITTCRDRITAELGEAPFVFAYPNGGPGDYTKECVTGLKEAGFTAACSMINSRVTLESDLLELPRYGTPESVWEAEATVSGAFEAVKTWRRSASNTFMSFLS